MKLSKKVVLDLGTVNCVFSVIESDLFFSEPTVLAVSKIDGKVLAVGHKAKEMIGRTPDTIVASKPLKDGVIADYRVCEVMLKYFVSKCL